MVVPPDADVDMAAESAVSTAYGAAGERCMAGKVVPSRSPDPATSTVDLGFPRTR